MKKIISTLFLVTICFTLVGCGNDINTKEGCEAKGYEWLESLEICDTPYVEPSEPDPEITEQRECSERTNSYQKCSWSFSEDMCTCKQR